MAIYAISDLHLPLGVKKSMNIFGKAWDNYIERLEYNWNAKIKPCDTVILPGDLSWATYLNESYEDFKFINALYGKKIILKGNHDYYFTTLSKMNKFFKENNFDTINVLQNNCFLVENTPICGSRGWDITAVGEEDKRLVLREAARLDLSLAQAEKNYPDLPVYVFLHYPPICKTNSNNPILDVIKKYNVKNCYYGHLHARGIETAFIGENDNVSFSLISADYLQFNPLLIK